MFQKIGCCLLFALFFIRAGARVQIIPQPVTVTETGNKGFTWDAHTRIAAADPSLQSGAAFLRNYLAQHYRLLPLPGSGRPGNTVRLRLDKRLSSRKGAYVLESGAGGILIRSSNPEGIFYGIQSLIQLLPVPDSMAGRLLAARQLPVPAVLIRDEPRFAYRGMHLDVARHFFPVSFVKQYIDLLALHKMNYFHWHLTDDQGWRIEIRKYPLLTRTGGYRNGTITGHHPGTGNDNTPYGGFYTQEEIREVVRYAGERFITVIPEIEMPGHASAAIAAYPELSCFPDSPTVMTGPVSRAGDPHRIKKVQETWGVFEDVFCPSDYTFRFLEAVLDEVMALFPSAYIHIGGDECPKDAWKKSAFCQSLMRQQGLKDEQELQRYFIGKMERYLHARGRRIIGWDEILEGGLVPDATVMSWRGEEGGIAAAGLQHQVVMTPGGYLYFDHAQARQDDSLTIGGYTSIQKVYSYEPVPAALDKRNAQYILGAQANLWTEYITNPEKVQYQVLPRMSALSEVLWSPAAGRSWAGFEPRLLLQLSRYRFWGLQYSKALFNPANRP